MHVNLEKTKTVVFTSDLEETRVHLTIRWGEMVVENGWFADKSGNRCLKIGERRRCWADQLLIETEMLAEEEKKTQGGKMVIY